MQCDEENKTFSNGNNNTSETTKQKLVLKRQRTVELNKPLTVYCMGSIKREHYVYALSVCGCVA